MGEVALVADIGGTNVRLALYDLQTRTLSEIQTQQISKDHDLLTLIRDYLAVRTVEIESACLAVACPVEGDVISMTNNHWSFSQTHLQNELGLKRLKVINDFTAVSMSVPELTTQDRVQIGGTEARHDFPIAIYGAGTGLGVSHLLNVSGRWVSLAGEGGHVDFSPGNDLEDQIAAHLREKFGRVSAERLLSGAGLVNIYQALRAINQQSEDEISANIIVSKALSNESVLCHQTLTLFCSMMGRFAGNLALTLNTQGGVYIGGGIVPRFIAFFEQSSFRKAFEDKGRMRHLLVNIPVFVITHPQPGLLGAGAYLRSVLDVE